LYSLLLAGGSPKKKIKENFYKPQDMLPKRFKNASQKQRAVL
jgi:hypothetical protein